MNNPYKKPVALDIKVPAEMLETVAGYPDEARIDRELTFGMSAVDLRDPATLQWIAALIDMKLTLLDNGKHGDDWRCPTCGGRPRFDEDGPYCPVC